MVTVLENDDAVVGRIGTTVVVSPSIVSVLRDVIVDTKPILDLEPIMATGGNLVKDNLVYVYDPVVAVIAAPNYVENI